MVGKSHDFHKRKLIKMIRKFQLSFMALLGSIWVSGQCSNLPCTLPVQAQLYPQDACNICLLSDLNSYSGKTIYSVPIPTDLIWPTSFCGTIEYNQWLVFTAPTTKVTFFFEVSNCEFPQNGGIQAQVYGTRDCEVGSEYFEVSDCWSEGIESDFSLTAEDLRPGEVYYLMIDGFAGDVCDFTISVTDPPGGSTPSPPFQLEDIIGDDKICISEIGTYTFPVETASGLSFFWSVSSGNGEIINNSNNDSVFVQWNSPGLSLICADVMNMCVPPVQQKCFEVEVLNASSATTIETDFCDGSSVTCGGQVYDAPGVYTNTFISSQGCDSVVTCVISLLPPSFEYKYEEICEGECIVADGQLFCDDGFYEIVFPGGSWTGCDSVLNLEVHVIDIPTTFLNVTACGDDCYEVAGQIYCETSPFDLFLVSEQGCDSVIRVTPNIIGVDVEIAEPAALTCLVDTVILDATGSTVGDSVTYIWTGPPGFSIIDSFHIAVTESGLYCFSVIDTVNAEECIECVSVLEITSPPDTPIVYGPDVIYGDFGLFYTDEVPFANEYYWGGEPIIFQNNTGNQIVVDVSDEPPLNNSVSVVVENDCGTSAQGIKPFIKDFLNLDVEIIGPSEVCNSLIPYPYFLETSDTSITNIEWVAVGNESLTIQQTGLALVDWHPGSSINIICANIKSNIYGNYQTCLNVDFLSTDTTIINAPICAGDCFNYQGIDYCDGGVYDHLYTAQDGCDSLVRVQVSQLASPTAELDSGSFTICEGEVLDLQIHLTGEAPWTVEWQVNGAIMPPLNIDFSPYILTVDESAVGLVELISVYDQYGCEGTVTGQAFIDVAPALNVSNLQIFPAPDLLTYQLYFEISGGDPSTYWVTPLNGTIQSAFPISFMSFPIQCGDGYYFEVSDGSGCLPIIIQSNGTFCECETEAGDMDSMPIEVCGDGPITGTYDNTGLFLDQNDALNFLLHSGNPFNSSDHIQLKTFESFAFVSSLMTYGQTYYISAVAGNDAGNGLVDFTDPCLDISQSQPIVFNAAPTAILSGGGEICEASGDSIDLEINLTGVGPWAVSYTDGVGNYMITTDQNPTFISVDQAGVYTLVGVSDANCDGTFFGQVTVDEVPTPTAEIIGSGSICSGSTGAVDLEITLTGTAPWVLFYEVNGGLPIPITINASPYFTSIPVNQGGLFTFTELQDANCEGEILGNGVIQITQAIPPIFTNLSQICDATATQYEVSFEVASSMFPIEINPPGSGTLSQSPPYIFVSNPIPSGTNYTFEIIDASGCDPVIVTGNHICDCVTSSGTMDVSLIEECGQGPITALYDQTNEMLDADDVLVFILHEGNGFNIINQIDVNTIEPTFSFLQGQMTYGTTYYISAVVGSDDGTGMPDLNDPCLVVAPGTPVTFYDVPTAFLYANPSTLCEDEVELIIEFSGTGPWTFVYEELNSGATVGGNTFDNPDTFSVVANGNSIFTLNSVSNANCNGTVSGMVEVNGSPVITSISNDTTICDNEFLELTVESPTAVEYQWTPAIGLSCTDCQNPIAAPSQSTNYTVIVTDNQGCTAEENVEVFVQCLTVYDTTFIGGVNIFSLNLPPWIPIQADVCIDEEEHTSIGWFPNGFFYTGLSEGMDTICIPLQHPSSIFNTDVFTIYITVEKKSIFMFDDDSPSSQIWGFEKEINEEKLIENEIQIYPNPTNGILNIDSKNELIQSIELIDLTGKSVFERVVNDYASQLIINGLNAGSYFVKIKTEREILIRKVILLE